MEPANCASSPGIVKLEVVGEFRYPLAKQRYLDLWRARVCLVSAILRDRLGFFFGRQCHVGLQTPRLT